jgi:hypothetical protein
MGKWIIKKGDRPSHPRTIPLKMGTKKGKGTPTALKVPLPVIFSTVIVVAIYFSG